MDLTTFAPWFALLGSSAAAGTLASVILTWLQARFPVPLDGFANPLESLLMHALHAPRFVRLTSLVISFVTGSLAAIGVTRLDGSDPPLVFAALLSFAASQLVHLRDLSPFVPFRLLASEEVTSLIQSEHTPLNAISDDDLDYWRTRITTAALGNSITRTTPPHDPPDTSDPPTRADDGA